MDELQEIREQMAALKEKLNKQEIITEQNLSHVIKQKVKGMRAYFVLLIFLIPLFICYEQIHDNNLYRTITWGIFFLVCMCTRLYNLLSLSNNKIMSGNTRDLLSKLQRLKRLEKGPFVLFGYSFLIIVIWGDGFIDICQMDVPFGKYHLLFIAVGLILFGFNWLIWKFIIQKLPSQWDEYIRQLEEITKDTGNEEAKEEKQ